MILNVKNLFLLVANSIRQRIKVLRQRYQTIANAELKLGLDVNHYVGKSECYSTNVRKNSKTIKCTCGNWKDLTVLAKTQKLQVLKELFLSLDDAGKMTCCREIFFGEKSELSRMIISLLQSIIAKEKNMEEIVKFMDGTFLSLAMKNGLSSKPKYFVSNSIKAMKRLSSENKPNLVYKFSQMLTLQKATNSPVIQLDRMPFGLLEYVIQFFTVSNVNQVQYNLWKLIRATDLDVVNIFIFL